MQVETNACRWILRRPRKRSRNYGHAAPPHQTNARPEKKKERRVCRTKEDDFLTLCGRFIGSDVDCHSATIILLFTRKIFPRHLMLYFYIHRAWDRTCVQLITVYDAAHRVSRTWSQDKCRNDCRFSKKLSVQ